ncbi:hypothetical protein M413DRAFT_27209 [Hebeloma cylindrosporum]|uniref:Uncharacterized protein n=1 Tax=Hebeloma cylindrosporum TaxID=76867 RepID=A0A0C2XXQ8_HEBCY|nr:hypothetical protein M413DRAFT_27209 [Hebeloma cylindrosporum h7]
MLATNMLNPLLLLATTVVDESVAGDQTQSRVLHLCWEIEQPQSHSMRTADNPSEEDHSEIILPRQRRLTGPYELYLKLFEDLPEGTPLWTPMYPGRNVSRSYKRKGIEIGDIGIITPHDGAFRYYFNIFHPPGHMENPADLPDDLLWTGLVPDFIDSSNMAGEVFMSDMNSAAIHENIDSLTLEYTMHGPQWAILIAPNGSKSKDLEDPEALSTYLKTRKAGLRKYFTEKHGTEIQESMSGNLHLVIGWTKTNSWGMATASHPHSSPHPCHLKLSANLESPMIPKYRWDCSENFVSRQSGPELNEIRDLREDSEDSDVIDVPVQQRFNQCLFVRTRDFDIFEPENTSNKTWQEKGDIGVGTQVHDGSVSVGHSMTGPSTGVGTTGTTNALGFSTCGGSMSGQQRNPLVLASPDVVDRLSHFTTLSASPQNPYRKSLILENMDRPEVPRSSSIPSSSRHLSHRSLHGKSSTQSKERKSTGSSNQSLHASSRPISPCPTVSSISSSLSTPPLSISSSFSDTSMPASPRSISKHIPQILSPVEETCTYTIPERGVHHEGTVDPEDKAVQFTDGRDDPSPSCLQEQLPENPIVILDFLG